MFPASRQTAAVSAMIVMMVTTSARPAPYEVSYYAPESEGSAQAEGLAGPYPEDQGWEWVNNGVTRSIDNGALLLQGFEPWTWDFYRKEMYDTLNPGPGEFLYIECRALVEESSSGTDTGFGVALDHFGGDVSITIATDRVRDGEGGESSDFEPGVSHTILFCSLNLSDYDLFVDGAKAFSDVFKLPTTLNSRVGWGDTATGFSTSRWEFFRFGAAKLGDINIDGRVDLSDFVTFAQCFGSSVDGPPASCSDRDAVLSDLNDDGGIDLNDFVTFAGNFTG